MKIAKNATKTTKVEGGLAGANPYLTVSHGIR